MRPHFVPDIGGDRSCAIGAASREIPYWTLLDRAGRPWGRLCLAFLDEDQAREEIWRQLSQDYPDVIQHGIRRSLRNVEVSPQANVVRVPYDQALVLTLQNITLGPGDVRTPEALLREDFDVARVMRNEFPRVYELAVVTEAALGAGLVQCSPGLEFIFDAVA